MRAKLVLGALVFGVIGAIAACGSAGNGSGFQPNGGGDGGDGDDGSVLGGDGGFNSGDGSTVGDGGVIVGDPKNCADAKTSKSYVGCDYWPTVTANGVWSIFDYAVVVSNVGTAAADITVTGGDLGADGGTSTVTASVAPGALQTIYLPWVPELKGVDNDQCGSATPLPHSVLKTSGAYHLVSTTPIVVWQFNALEYGPTGGPTGKDWSTCPGGNSGPTCTNPDSAAHIGCQSYTNDASLLLPSTAMTLNYRVSGYPGIGSGASYLNPYFTVTATADNTDVTVTLSSAGATLATSAAGITATAGSGTLKFNLAHAGDVAEVAGTNGASSDFSGSLVQSSLPVQVISGIGCMDIPTSASACDHLEQTVLPAETLGKHYVVSMPDKPGGGIGVGIVRFYGNEDGTTLTYNGGTPTGCPTTLNAGQVGQCSIGKVNILSGAVTASDVDVTGDKEFGVGLFQEGASVYGSIGGSGGSESDPSQTVIASVEQYRLKYLFLAPKDYDQSYADIVGTSDAAPILDGAAVTAAFKMTASGPYGVWRVTLNGGPKGDGAHTLTSTKPVGLQVVGYGTNTSYQYPGGLNLNQIAPSPPPPR